MNIVRYAGALALVSMLAGCAPPPPNPLDARATYVSYGLWTAVVVAADNYKHLPPCPAGASPSPLCMDPAILAKVKVYVKDARIKLDELRAFQVANPTLTPAAYVAAANLAISIAQQFLTDNHIAVAATN